MKAKTANTHQVIKVIGTKATLHVVWGLRDLFLGLQQSNTLLLLPYTPA